MRGLLKGGLFTRIKMMKLGTGSDVPRLNNVGERLKYAIIDVFGHKKILREPYQGIAHLFVFWGFVALFIGTAIDFFTG